MNPVKPPELTSGAKYDPLQEVLGGQTLTTTGIIRSPPPRFYDNQQQVVTASRPYAGPVVAQPYSRPSAGGPTPPQQEVAETTAFNRSEVAARIRQSFDALVKASPIGVPLTTWRFSSPHQSIPPQTIFNRPTTNAYNNPLAFAPPPPASATQTTPSFGALHRQPVQEQQQLVETHEIRRTIHSHSPTFQAVSSSTMRVVRQIPQNTIGDAQPQYHPLAPPPVSLMVEEIPSGEATMMEEPGDAFKDRPLEHEARAADDPLSEKKSTPCTDMAVGGARPKPTTSKRQKITTTSKKKSSHKKGTNRELASLIPSGRHPRARRPGSEEGFEDAGDEGGAFETSRSHGRARTSSLAWWANERLIVGHKDEGAQGYEKGSGDLTAGGGSTAKAKKKAGSKLDTATKKNRKNSDKVPPASATVSPGAGGIAAMAVAAAVRAAEAATKNSPSGPQENQPVDDVVPSETLPSALPEIAGVPREVVETIAAQSPNSRPRKCGHCKACLKPSLRKACELIRALGGNPVRKRQKKKHALVEEAAEIGVEVEEIVAMVEDEKQEDGAKIDEGDDPTMYITSTRKKFVPKPPAAAAGKRGAKRKAAEQAASEHTGQPSTVTHPFHDPKNAVKQGLTSTSPAVNSEQVTAAASLALWTSEQTAALHKAWLEISPTIANFWAVVASKVPGRNAAECYAKMFEKHPTPEKKKAPVAGARKLLAVARGEDKQPGELLLKAGQSKQAVHNAVRKMARQQRMQQRVEEAADEEDEELIQALEKQQQKDKYVDQILRKRRGRALGLAPSRGGGTVGIPSKDALQGKKGNSRSVAAMASAQEVREALIAAKEQEADRDSGEESDYYWSDAD